MTLSNSTALAAALRDGSVGVAFMRPSGADLAELHAVPFPHEPLIAAVATGHAALEDCADGPLPLASVASNPFILTPRAIGSGLFDAAIRRHS